jgi:hypothetical protein
MCTPAQVILDEHLEPLAYDVADHRCVAFTRRITADQVPRFSAALIRASAPG